MPAENLATFTNEERNAVLYHLGYFLADRVTTFALGIPAASQPMFIAEGALGRVPQSAKRWIDRTIGVLEGIEMKLIEAQDYLPADKLGELTINQDNPNALEREYLRWAKRLSDILGAPLNPFSERFRGVLGMPRPLNVPVSRW